MPEIPDFDALAGQLVALGLRVTDGHGGLVEGPVAVAYVVEKFRQIWNARGAADLAVVDQSLSAQMGGAASGPYLNNLEREIRKLDR